MSDMNETDISWADYTWNPVHGCHKVSPGCRNCYAETISRRFEHTTQPWTAEHADENVQLKEHKLDAPLADHEPGRVFVNSMSDLFHEEVPDSYITRVMEVIASVPEDVFIILTKRPERAARWEWYPENVWLGTSVESGDYTDRITAIAQSEASTKWVSFEPLIDSVGNVTDVLRVIDWVVVGGESGPDHREMKHEWAREILWQARATETAFFFKQSAAQYPERGRELELVTGEKRRIEQYPPLPDRTIDAREGGEPA
ncbi:MAG: DUF5131 family protein [Halobacteriales archaeon]